MAWIVLIVSGCMEAVWATALGYSDGLKRLGPSAVFLVALLLSMLGLAWAVKSLPAATAYVVWTAIGASLAVAYAMITGNESASPVRIFLICVIILCVVALKMTTGESESVS